MLVQAMIQDLIGKDQILQVPLRELCQRPGFLRAQPLAGGPQSRLLRDALMAALAGVFQPVLMQSVGPFLEGYLGVESSDQGRQDAEPCPSRLMPGSLRRVSHQRRNVLIGSMHLWARDIGSSSRPVPSLILFLPWEERLCCPCWVGGRKALGLPGWPACSHLSSVLRHAYGAIAGSQVLSVSSLPCSG